MLSREEILALNQKTRELREAAIRNQGPITTELAYSQVQRHHGYWPLIESPHLVQKKCEVLG
jgi:hypothetical protein